MITFIFKEIKAGKQSKFYIQKHSGYYHKGQLDQIKKFIKSIQNKKLINLYTVSVIYEFQKFDFSDIGIKYLVKNMILKDFLFLYDIYKLMY